MKKLIAAIFLSSPLFLFAQNAEVSKRTDAITDKIVNWRRDFHEHPELGNEEKRTAAIIAKHLQDLGMEVKTGVAKTGVVGVL